MLQSDGYETRVEACASRSAAQASVMRNGPIWDGAGRGTSGRASARRRSSPSASSLFCRTAWPLTQPRAVRSEGAAGLAGSLHARPKVCIAAFGEMEAAGSLLRELAHLGGNDAGTFGEAKGQAHVDERFPQSVGSEFRAASWPLRLHRRRPGVSPVPSIDQAMPDHAVSVQFSGAQGAHAGSTAEADSLAERPKNFLVPDGGRAGEDAVDEHDPARVVFADGSHDVALLRRGAVVGIEDLRMPRPGPRSDLERRPCPSSCSPSGIEPEGRGDHANHVDLAV